MSLPTNALMRGKHLTPGIVDEHTHIAATRGIEHASQRRRGDHSILREQRGREHLPPIGRGRYHGADPAESANPIGKRHHQIPVGRLTAKMLFEEASPFIEFALGENVKQSNWAATTIRDSPKPAWGGAVTTPFLPCARYDQTWKDYANT